MVAGASISIKLCVKDKLGCLIGAFVPLSLHWRHPGRGLVADAPAEKDNVFHFLMLQAAEAGARERTAWAGMGGGLMRLLFRMTCRRHAHGNA
jgi:hypothetical protein